MLVLAVAVSLLCAGAAAAGVRGAEVTSSFPAAGEIATTGGARSTSLLADVVVVGVPGLRWSDVQASPELTALVNEANVGSISVKTSSGQTCPIDGWLTISAGTRAWGSDRGQACPELPAVQGGRLTGWQSYLDLQAEHHTDAEPGRLGALGNRLCGFGPGGAVAVARPDGTVAQQGGSGTGPASGEPAGASGPGGGAVATQQPARWWPAFEPGLLAGCNDAVVDAGALPLREGRAEAVKRVADIVTQARAQGRWVVLSGISEEAAGAHRETLVTMQLPPDNGARWLTSASTRRPGLVQLTDLTATLLSDSAPDAPLDGAEITVTGDRHTDAATVIEDRLDTNQRFEQPPRMLLPVGLTLLVVQLVALAWYKLRHTRRARRAFLGALLTQGGFFSAVFLSTLTSWWRWPEPALALYAVTIALSAAVGAASYLVLKRRAVVGLALAAYVVLLVDGVSGTPLQVGSMFADGPVIGGRFFGFGNSTFAALAVATLVTAGAAGRRLLPRSRTRAALAVLAVGAAAVVVDGMPGWGTDFGGVIALTPAVLLFAWYTWRGSVSWQAVLGIGLTGFVAVAALALADYQRPPADRTHFGAFVARLLDGDVGDLFARKLEMSFGFLTGPAGWAMGLAGLAAMAACVVPQRVPAESYRRFAGAPLVRPGLLALALCGLIGWLLNDAGVTVPAIMTGFALPLIVAQLLLRRADAATASPAPGRR